jgi:ubiquinone/menaquinone biosynthesis C-methylase UbiE
MDHHTHKFEVSHKKRLDSEERKRQFKPEETIKRLGYTEGRDFADIGCGVGLFTIPAAEIGGSSAKVYAVDISDEMLREVAGRASERGLGSVRTVQSDEYDFRLEDGAADFVLISAVLHEIDDKTRFIAEARRICRKSGKIAVVEYNDAEIGFGPPRELRLPSGQVAELLKAAGFTGIEETSVSEGVYAVTAVKQ